MTIEDAKKARPGDKIRLKNLQESLEKYPYKNGDIVIVDDPPTEIINGIFFIRTVTDPPRILPKYAEFVQKDKLCSCDITTIMCVGCKCGGI